MGRTASRRPAAPAPGAPLWPADPAPAGQRERVARRSGGRPAGVRTAPPGRRRPHSAVPSGVLAAVLTGLLAAGCANTTAGSGRPARGVGAAAGSASAEPTGTATAPSGPATPTGPSRSVRFGRLTVPVPAGAVATVRGESLCLTLQGDDRCSLDILDVGRTLAAGGSVSTPAPGEKTGWWWGPGAPSCGDGGTTSPVRASKVVERGFRKVGPKTAAYSSWRVSCANHDLDFDPRLWWLPNSRIAFRQRSTAAGSRQTVDGILAAVTFG